MICLVMIWKGVEEEVNGDHIFQELDVCLSQVFTFGRKLTVDHYVQPGNGQGTVAVPQEGQAQLEKGCFAPCSSLHL